MYELTKYIYIYIDILVSDTRHQLIPVQMSVEAWPTIWLRRYLCIQRRRPGIVGEVALPSLPQFHIIIFCPPPELACFHLSLALKIIQSAITKYYFYLNPDVYYQLLLIKLDSNLMCIWLIMLTSKSSLAHIVQTKGGDGRPTHISTNCGSRQIKNNNLLEGIAEVKIKIYIYS